MTRQQHLLIALMEECAEVQQAASKVLRFGLDDKYKDQPTNQERLSTELTDLIAVCDMIVADVVPDSITPTGITDKKKKVEQWLAYSQLKGY